jgi:hypothetical protein
MNIARQPWWRRHAATHAPHKVINGRAAEGPPLIVRWKLLGIPGLKVYIHKICRPDDTPDYHDHPWPFWHRILEGAYREELPGGRSRVLREGYSAFHGPGYAHRVADVRLPKDPMHGSGPIETETYFEDAWTLVVVGPRLRHWGFVDAARGCWTPWERYTAGERC